MNRRDFLKSVLTLATLANIEIMADSNAKKMLNSKGIMLESKNEKFKKLCHIFDDEDFKIYAMQVASNHLKPTLFASINPQETFIQTATDYASSINVFIVEFKSNGKRIMIDTGFGFQKDKLPKILNAVEIEVDSISDIYVTHIHPDHVGGLKDFPKAQIHIAKKEYEAWKEDSKRKSCSQYLPEPEKLDLFEYDKIFENEVHAIKCTGHTPGHTVYRIKDFYFIGDLFHAVELQLPHPSFCALPWDSNPIEAVASRKYAIEKLHGKWLGAHIPFPGMIHN